MPNKSLRKIRDELTQKCVAALLSYRKNCASNVAPAQVAVLCLISVGLALIPLEQLILPEQLKLLPLLTLTVMKNRALKGKSSYTFSRTPCDLIL